MQFNTLIELITTLKTERDCHHYLASERWRDGVLICPYCSHERAYVFRDGIRYKCTACRKIYTAKTGTFMEASKLPTIKWLVAIWLMLHKTGISSVQLGKDFGVTQKTSWFMLQRIRWAFGNEVTPALSGVIEIDETFVGGRNQNRHKAKRVEYNPGRSWSDKIPVFGILERGGKLVAGALQDVTMLSIRNAIDSVVVRGSSVMADGFTGYKPLRLQYHIQQVDHARGVYVNGDVHTNTIESAWNQFKRCIRGNYVHLGRKHIDKYIAEFVFRYNNRNLAIPNQMVCVVRNMNCRLKYRELTAA